MAQSVTELEYFFDADPGFGNGTSIAVTEVDGEVNYEGSITTSSLSRGLHTLFIRAKNSDDEWGLTIKKLILVDQGEAREIEALEYFYDEDPGLGMGTEIQVSQALELDLETTISTSGISRGIHTLYLRAKFTDGAWGFPIKKMVLIDQNDPNSVSEIVAAEYFFNTDPGFASATPISINTGTDIEATFTIPSSNLPIGDQVLFIRVQDSDGVWGQYSSKSFALSEVPMLAFESSDTSKFYTDTGKLHFAGNLGISSTTEITADSAIVSFTGGFILDEDSLGIEDEGSMDIELGDGWLKLTGNDDLDEYQEVLKSVFYTRKEGHVFSDTLKEFSISVYSGAFSSEPVQKYIHVLAVDSMGTDNEAELELPIQFSLDQNYPNPFNPSTNINFAIPKSSKVQLVVYNLLGQQVATLVDRDLSAGNHAVRFEASQLSSGVYIYRIQAGSFVQTKKMMLIK
ncbi:MAG: T9SS type A sorting domain-containing protein [Balneolaceae bacterium]